MSQTATSPPGKWQHYYEFTFGEFYVSFFDDNKPRVAQNLNYQGIFHEFLNIVATALLVSASGAALATPGTETSPTGGPLPAGVTKVGGIVLDLKGTSGNRVVSQLAASSLFSGTQPGTPLLIGTQSGFTAATIAALGGGLTSASIRVSLYDGDTQSGNFDFNNNTLTANGVNFGNFSSVATEETNSTGTTTLSSGFGFGNNILSTGFFSLSNVGDLATFYGSLAGGSVAYRLVDSTFGPGFTTQFYDFTLGVDGGLINTGTGPVINPPTPGAVPEPATWAMMIGGFGMVGGSMRYRRRKTTVAFA